MSISKKKILSFIYKYLIPYVIIVAILITYLHTESIILWIIICVFFSHGIYDCIYKIYDCIENILLTIKLERLKNGTRRK